jgi:hypothetical protein
MEAEITKISPTLGKDCLYNKISKISKLVIFLVSHYIYSFTLYGSAGKARISKQARKPPRLSY